MKEKVKPKVWMKHSIKNKNDIIGYIQLVEYYTNGSIPHIEYEVNSKFRSQGIMTKELPKYLRRCKKWGHNRLLGIVESNNVISQKLLERNGFFKLLSANDYVSYIIDLNISRKDIQFILANMRAAQLYNQRIADAWKK